LLPLRKPIAEHFMVASPNAEPDGNESPLAGQPALGQPDEAVVALPTDARSPQWLSPQPVPQWASPPEPISQILDAPSTPDILISPDKQWLVELAQPSLPTIAELAEPVVAVAGFRLNPKTNAPARHRTYRGMRLRALRSDISNTIALPDDSSY
jgi:hypothetical protein